MANKKPLAHYSGVIKELQSGDAVAGTDLEATYFNNWNDAFAIAIGLNRIISGNATWSGSGLTFNITPSAGFSTLVWTLQGTRFTANSTTVTSATADATNPRIDVIYFDSSGLIGIITGTPAASPSKPVVDPTTQIELTSVNIAAGATTPTVSGNLTAYNENTEWTVASTNGTLNAANTTAPKAGTKHISIGSFTNGQNITLTDSGTHDASQLQYLTFSLRLLATFNNSTFLSFYFANGSAPVSNQISLSSGSYGFLRTTTGSYQDLAIPISAFKFTSTIFNRIYIVLNGSNASGFYLDLVVLQGGITQPSESVVNSFNTRTGNVTPQTGDYTAAQVGAVATNTAITGATKTKITYDTKGLVTGGADATTADIADSSNKRYVTDAQLVVVGNTSGTNTGDQNLSTYAPLASPVLTGNPTAPTQTAGNNSTRVATTAYVDSAVGVVANNPLMVQIFS